MPDIVTGKIWVDGEKGVTATKMNQVTSLSVIQPDFYLNKPTSPTLDPTDTLLELKGSGSYAQITGSQLITSVSSQVNVQPQIWSTRLRSFNAVGNPNFEVDQRNVGTQVTNPSFCMDRWLYNKSGTMSCATQQTSALSPVPTVPGTNFQISRSALKIQLSTQQATLGAGDFLFVNGYVEGPNFRELANDVHSISLLIYSTVAPLKFSVSLRDSPTTKSLVKLCTIPSASTWTLIQLPNIPIWPSANFTTAPGVVSYILSLCFASGTTYVAPAADTWQSGNFLAAPTTDNWCANAVNSQILIACIQDEPGSQCTILMDKPFTQNLDECLRYYCKTYDYSMAVGTVTGSANARNFIAPTTTQVTGAGSTFPKIMAKTPTCRVWNPSTGAQNSLFNNATGGAVSVTSIGGVNTQQLASINATVTANTPYLACFDADTGW